MPFGSLTITISLICTSNPPCLLLSRVRTDHTFLALLTLNYRVSNFSHALNRLFLFTSLIFLEHASCGPAFCSLYAGLI